MKPIILGSSSPRRADYLKCLGVDFHRVQVPYDETIVSSDLSQIADELVQKKLDQLRSALKQDPTLWPADCSCLADLGLLLVADTLVMHQGEVLGKPLNKAQAQSMLQKLSGDSHQVITGVGIGDFSKQELIAVITEVHFRKITEQEISAYIATNEPMDKAGSYGLQGLGGSFVNEVKGSVSGVVGLPLAETQALLTRWGQAHRLGGAE